MTPIAETQTEREARARRVLDKMGVDTSDAAILLALLGLKFE